MTGGGVGRGGAGPALADYETKRYRSVVMDASGFPEKEPASDTDAAARPDPRIERSRAKLIAAATELLVESGPSALTVDNVAERSGVAKSTLYRHWPSRTALMVDVLRANMPCAPEVPPDADFVACLRTYMRALAGSFTDPEWARILPALFTLKQHLPEVDDLAESDRDEQVAALTALLDRGVAEGVIPPGLDPQAVIAALVGPMMMCALIGDLDAVPVAGEFALDRLLASYRD